MIPIRDGVIRGTMNYALPAQGRPSDGSGHARRWHEQREDVWKSIRRLKKYLCKSIWSKCWECECADCCQYGQVFLRLLEEREDEAGRRWTGYVDAARRARADMERENAELYQKRQEKWLAKCKRQKEERERAAGTKEAADGNLQPDTGEGRDGAEAADHQSAVCAVQSRCEAVGVPVPEVH